MNVEPRPIQYICKVCIDRISCNTFRSLFSGQRFPWRAIYNVISRLMNPSASSWRVLDVGSYATSLSSGVCQWRLASMYNRDVHVFSMLMAATVFQLSVGQDQRIELHWISFFPSFLVFYKYTFYYKWNVRYKFVIIFFFY